MRKLVFLIAFLLLHNAAFADCRDDPRLADLPSMLAAGALPEKPFYLTPESFIRLQPQVRETLGNTIVICPKNIVKDGVPLHPAKVKVDINVIREALEEAINLDDWNNVKYIRDHAEPYELSPEAVFSLLVIPIFSETDVKKLETVINLNLGYPLKQVRNSEPTRALFLADIFAAFGGKATDNPTIIWSQNLVTLEEARALAENRGLKNHIFMPYSGYAIDRAINAMSKFGMEMIEAWDFIHYK